MLALDRVGAGPPLVLLHGTNASRAMWRPILPKLRERREVYAVDLPAHGDSPPTSLTPPGFARDVAATFDELGLAAPAVVGHSVGGWTALELAKLGRAGAVLALAPAGLWRSHSPPMTDFGLVVNWWLGRRAGGMAERSLRSRLGRRIALRSISARPGDVPHDVAVETARAAIASKHFLAHFRATRVLRFEDGRRIPPRVPVRVVWGARDKVARARTSRFEDELPAHAVVETWEGSGHMLLWDRADAVVDAALATRAPC